MGYTTYFQTSKPVRVNKEVADKINEFLSSRPAIINECDPDEDFATISPSGFLEVCFNGSGEFGYETFYFVSDGVWRFTKTARKHYDFEVSVVCLIIKAYLSDFELSSDGFSGYLSEENVSVGDEVRKGDGTWIEAMTYVNKKYNRNFTAMCSKVRGLSGKNEFFDYVIDEV